MSAGRSASHAALPARPPAPSPLALGWAVLMEPVTLAHAMDAQGLASLSRPLPSLLWRGAAPWGHLRSLLVWLLLGPVLGLGLGAGLHALGLPLPATPVVALTVTTAGIGLLVALVTSVLAGALFALTMPAACVVALLLGAWLPEPTLLVARSAVVAAATGFVVATAVSHRNGEPASALSVLLLALALTGLLWFTRGVAGPRSLAVSLAAGAGFAAGGLRLWLYPLELALDAVLWALARAGVRGTLAWVPVLHHDLGYLPHPLLVRHVLRVAPAAPELVRRVLAACFISPGQRTAGRRLLRALGVKPSLVEPRRGVTRLG